VRIVWLFVCVALWCHLGGGLDRRACWLCVGLVRSSGTMPASLFRLRCFLRVFVLMVCVVLSQRRGGKERWPLIGLVVLWEDEV
jgi:hypothetical protein